MRWRGIFFGRLDSAGGGSDCGSGEEVVHAAGAIAFSVECDVEEAERLDGGGGFFEDREREGAGAVFAGDLDAGEVAVAAAGHLWEAEAVESGVGLFFSGEGYAG